MITELSSLLCNEWRSSCKQKNGSFEPRMEKTKDKEWIRIHGTDGIDIASTSFAELPKDWQKENRIAAEIVMNEVFRAVESGRSLNEVFVEEASAVVHGKWLERNSERASIEQRKLFRELSENEKEKDRIQIRKAIEIFQSRK